VAGTGTHYHLLVPDAGPPRAALAGGATDRCLLLRIVRAERVVDGALAVKSALGSWDAGVLDPALAGGCGDAADHGALEAGRRNPPPIRVVRVRIPAAEAGEVDGILGKVPGLAKVHAARMGGEPAGEVTLDVHVIP
jgi:hypothetical protein